MAISGAYTLITKRVLIMSWVAKRLLGYIMIPEYPRLAANVSTTTDTAPELPESWVAAKNQNFVAKNQNYQKVNVAIIQKW